MKIVTSCILILTIVLLTNACKKEMSPSTTEQSQPITVPTIPDAIMPSTNIPDPNVENNSSMPQTEDPITETETSPENTR